MPLFFPPSRSLPLAQSGVAGTSLTGTLTETVLDTITLPAGSMGANGRINFYFAGTQTNNANNKSWRLRMGGIGGTVLASILTTTTATLLLTGTTWNVNSQSSQRTSFFCPRGSDALLQLQAENTAAIDTSAATTLVITGQLANVADSMQRTGYWFDVVKG